MAGMNTVMMMVATCTMAVRASNAGPTDEEIVIEFVRAQGNKTFRPASGA